MSKTKEEILKEFRDLKFENKQHFGRNADSEMIFEKVFEPLLAKVEAKTREETIREEIAYWTDVFDNRPKNRDLESDNIAQNFARIEIERLENKLK